MPLIRERSEEPPVFLAIHVSGFDPQSLAPGERQAVCERRGFELPPRIAMKAARW
jgi:hypothetical protein